MYRLDNLLNPKIVALTHYAENIEEVLDQLEMSLTGSSKLVRGRLCGSDVMASVKIVEGSRVLLFGQLKPYLQGNVNSLDSETMADAL